MSMLKKRKMNLRPVVGAIILALAAPAAMAAVTPPATNSLPGNFYSNFGSAAATYAAGSNSAATITLNGASAAVLQWGGSNGGLTATKMATASNANPATNAGFDIGAGATLNIASSGTAPTAVLINDITGNPSQVYGNLSASVSAPVYIANANGIIVGSGGSIVAPSGLALDGYAQDAGSFTSAAGIAIGSGAVGTGDITIAPGASLNAGAGFLLVAGNANVNIGSALVTAGSTAIAAGYAVTATTSALQPLTISSAAVLNSAATVNFNNVSGTASVASLGAAGNVNVLGGANVSLPSSATTYIGNNFVNGGTTTLTDNLTAVGSFTNNGLINDASSSAAIAANGSSGSLVNNGVINLTSASASTLTLSASTVGGTVTNNGIINFSNGGLTGILNVTGANINLYGAVNQASSAGATPTALSSKNALAGVSLTANTSGGVLNLGTMLYSDSAADALSGAAVRVLSGGYSNVNAAGTLSVTLGSGKVGSYGYNLSLFPGAALSAPTVNISGANATNGSNLNLFGTITGSTVAVSANTVNANSAGGFSVSQGGTLTLNVAGNVNNPNGAAAAGSTAFNYNYVPVTMQGTGGTLTVTPSAYTSQAQFVNVLVNGNATLGATGYTAPLAFGANIVPNASYPNSHLVVSATGNLSLGGFNWPGLLYLANVSSASNPTVLSSSGTITLAGAVTNVIPTNVGLGGGIWFMTNKALSGISSTNYVETNTNSYVNFPASSGLVASYQAANPISNLFYGATPNANASNLLTTQLLPTSNIYGR